MCLLHQILHHGTTVLNFDPETNQVVSVFLKLESCNGTITWCRPPWSDLRKGAGLIGPAGTVFNVMQGGSGATTANLASAAANGIGPAITTTSASEADTSLDTIENAVSPGLRLKYTNRSGESMAYSDEGYVELSHMKDLSLVGGAPEGFPRGGPQSVDREKNQRPSEPAALQGRNSQSH